MPDQNRRVWLPRAFRKAHNHHHTFATVGRLQTDVRVVAFGNRPYDGQSEAQTSACGV